MVCVFFQEPVGPVDFQPETFRKFLALHLHGAVN